MPRPERLQAAQDVAVAHRRAIAALRQEVRLALTAAVLADVKAVDAKVADGWVQVTVTARPWHDMRHVAAAVVGVEGVVEVRRSGRTVIGFRKIAGQK